MSQISGPNFGGPIGGNSAGEIFVGITGDLRPLRQALRQAEAEVKASSAKMEATASVPIGRGIGLGPGARGPSVTAGAHPGFGMGPGPGVSTISTVAESQAVAASLDAADRKSRGLLGTLRDVRRTVASLLVPAAVIFSVTRAVEAFARLKDAAREFGDELDRVGSTSARTLMDTVRELAVLEGRITKAQADAATLRDAQLEQEKEINKALVEREKAIRGLSGVAEGVSRGMTMSQLLAEARRDADDERRKTREDTKALIALNERLNATLRERQRLERLIREQRGSDITKTAIDASRIGQYLDILQRQRAAEAGA